MTGASRFLIGLVSWLVYRVEGGGHSWPGRIWYPDVLIGRTTRTLDATRVIWDFFTRH